MSFDLTNDSDDSPRDFPEERVHLASKGIGDRVSLFETDILKTGHAQHLTEGIFCKNGQMSQVTVDDLSRKKTLTIRGLNDEKTVVFESFVNARQQGEQFTFGEVFNKVDGKDEVVCVALSGEEREDISDRNMKSLLRSDLNLFGRNIYSFDIREPLIPEELKEVSGAATEFKYAISRTCVLKKRKESMLIRSKELLNTLDVALKLSAFQR